MKHKNKQKGSAVLADGTTKANKINTSLKATTKSSKWSSDQ